MTIIFNVYLISVVSAIICAFLIFYRMSKLMGSTILETLQFSSMPMVFVGIVIPVINSIVVIETICDMLFLSDEEFEEKFINIK